MTDLVAGVDVGGTKVLALASRRGEILAEVRLPTPVGGRAIIEVVVEAVARLERELGDRAGAVGVGIAGLVDDRGVLRFGPNLPGVVDLAVRSILAERLDRPVAVDNDATCALSAEWSVGAARGVRDAVLVTLGTGIGGGVVAGGVLQRGAHGFAGEFGHVMVDPRGPLCPCGRRGCWERYASGAGLRSFARRDAAAGRAPLVLELAGGDLDAIRAEHVTAAARRDDPAASALLDEVAWWVAVGVAGLVAVLDPEVVVIGGGLGGEAALLLDRIRAAHDELVMGREHRPPVALRAAEVGERAGALGAALLVAARGPAPGPGSVV